MTPRSLNEGDIRARIGAGSREISDYLQLANLLRVSSRFQEAAEIYEQGLRIDLPNAEKATLIWELGSLFDKVMFRQAEAVALARRALDLLAGEPDLPNTRLLRGLSWSLLAQAGWALDAKASAHAAENAIDLLERVIGEPGQFEEIAIAYTEAAWAHAALGRTTKAITLCRESLRRYRDARARLIARMILAEALRVAGQLEEAEDVATKALQDSAVDQLTRPRLFITLGLSSRALNRRDAAHRAFTRALEAISGSPFLSRDTEALRSVYGNLAELYVEEGKVATAINMFEQLLAQYAEGSQERPRILNWLGNCHASLGAHAQARRYFEQALSSASVCEADVADAQAGLTQLPPFT